MMQAYDPVCLDAFERLLARPDPRDLPRRAHVFSCDGDPTLILRTQRPAGLTTTSQERARLNADARDQSPLDLGAIDVYRWENEGGALSTPGISRCDLLIPPRSTRGGNGAGLAGFAVPGNSRWASAAVA
jgi:hypothetical protein